MKKILNIVLYLILLLFISGCNTQKYGNIIEKEDNDIIEFYAYRFLHNEGNNASYRIFVKLKNLVNVNTNCNGGKVYLEYNPVYTDNDIYSVCWTPIITDTSKINGVYQGTIDNGYYFVDIIMYNKKNNIIGYSIIELNFEYRETYARCIRSVTFPKILFFNQNITYENVINRINDVKEAYKNE